MASNLRHGFTLGKFRVLPLQGTVEGPDGERHIPPKVADVLLVLAEAGGEVVERKRIIAAVWGADGEHGEALTHCISELRHALDDHADHPEFIQTLPKRGYRLIQEPVPLHAPAAPQPPARNPFEALWAELKHRNVIRVAIAYAAIAWLLLQFADIVFEILRFPDWAIGALFFVLAVGFLISVVVAWLFQVVPEHEHESDQRQRLKTAVDVAIIAALAVAIGLLAYRQLWQAPAIFPTVQALPAEVTSPPPDPHSVAVLRFASFGGDSVFSNGLSEHLLNLLAQTGRLRVPSRQVTWMLSDQKVDPKVIARTLQVRYLLEGSVQQVAQRIRVTAQLIDGQTGNHVWSQDYDETLSAENFFRIQDSIASAVVSRLEATVGAPVESRPGTVSEDALRHYLAGRELLSEPKSAESIAEARAEFEAAIAIDTHFAAAYAGLCEAWLADYVTFSRAGDFAAGEAACMRAMRIDPERGEVYAALGSLHRYAGQYELAEQELLRARELLHDPTDVIEELGRTYRAQNKLVLAEQTFQEAIDIAPENWSVYKSMGNFLFRTGRYEEALPYYKQVTLMQRDSAAAFTNIGSAFYMLGDFDNATVAWERSLNLEPTHFAWMNLANGFYYRGRYADSADAYREAVKLGGDDARAWGGLAAACEHDGQSDCSADAYRRAVELLQTALSINPLDAPALARLAAYRARLGELDEAQQSLNRLAALDWDDPNVPFFVAHAQLAMGEDAEALSELRQAVIMGYPRALVAADPGFAGLREEPAFRELGVIGLD